MICSIFSKKIPFSRNCTMRKWSFYANMRKRVVCLPNKHTTLFLIIQHINYCFLFSNSVVIRHLCTAFWLIISQISTRIPSSWRQIVLIIINNAEITLINHLLVSLYIRCFTRISNLFRVICFFISFQ